MLYSRCSGWRHPDYLAQNRNCPAIKRPYPNELAQKKIDSIRVGKKPGFF